MTALPLSRDQIDALVSLRRIFGERQCVLIGAAALAIHVPLRRETKDVDLVVVVSETDLPNILEDAGWQRDKRMAQRWHSPGGAAADILPATAELVARGEIRFDGDTKSMSLLGFDLALKHTIQKDLPGTEAKIEIADLPVVVVLKMVAWLDRPAERSKDLGDLALILEKALVDADERRWDGPVFDSGLEHEDQSAFFVGLEVAKIAAPQHLEAVERFLARVEVPDSADFADMLREAAYVSDDPDGTLLRRWKAFRFALPSR